ncbi:MAG: transposase [Flammeovirgaceae bacterium]
MQYNSNIHNRRTIRLAHYDYSQAGYYFLTLCCQDRAHQFGKVIQGQMQLNPAGQMIKKWYQTLPNKFPNIQCHEMIIMPDHFHCIIEIKKTTPPKNIGADQRVNEKVGTDQRKNKVGTDQRVCPTTDNKHKMTPTIGDIIQWFKTMSTNEYIRGVKQKGWPRFNKRLWQRNYYEHIIRNDQALENIRKYIINNPKKWQEDRSDQ